jgi:glycosyltransferase involved in cell wall biosynthesis
VLFGGWQSRGMRLFLESAKASDPRISWRSGDPSELFATAALAVHPTWEDGWGYAPAEALAAGVPLLISDQTGMKELLNPDSGSILPAGDRKAWGAALERWLRGTTP